MNSVQFDSLPPEVAEEIADEFNPVPDTFGLKIKKLSKDNYELLELISEDGTELFEVIDGKIRDCREKSLAKTKLEECIIWAIKAVNATAKNNN